MFRLFTTTRAIQISRVGSSHGIFGAPLTMGHVQISRTAEKADKAYSLAVTLYEIVTNSTIMDS